MVLPAQSAAVLAAAVAIAAAAFLLPPSSRLSCTPASFGAYYQWSSRLTIVSLPASRCRGAAGPLRRHDPGQRHHLHRRSRPPLRRRHGHPCRPRAPRRGLRIRQGAQGSPHARVESQRERRAAGVHRLPCALHRWRPAGRTTTQLPIAMASSYTWAFANPQLPWPTSEITVCYHCKLFLSMYCTSLLILLSEYASVSEGATSRGHKQR